MELCSPNGTLAFVHVNFKNKTKVIGSVCNSTVASLVPSCSPVSNPAVEQLANEFLDSCFSSDRSLAKVKSKKAVGLGSVFIFPAHFVGSEYEYVISDLLRAGARAPQPYIASNPYASVPDQISERHATAQCSIVNVISFWVSNLFPSATTALSGISVLVREAYATTNLVFNEEDALRWADDFTFPAGLGDRDSMALQRHGFNLASMVREFQSRMPHSRLSHEAVETWISPTNPDYANIKALVDGVPFLVPANFRPNERPYGLRKKYVHMAPVINKLMYDLYMRGLCIIMHTEEAIKILSSTRFGLPACRPLQYSSVHWCPKRGKEKGRPLGDSSAEESGNPLNSEVVKQMVDERWGVITHPTIERLVAMVLRVAEEEGWDNIILYKMDLRSAFSLLQILPEDVGLSAFELTNGLTLIQATGWFGWTGMPGTFQVVTRTLVTTAREQPGFTGELDMFVDDILGACRISHVNSNLSILHGMLTGILGSDAVEGDKTIAKRCLDWIGWAIDLDNRTVSVAKHNMLKTLYGFFTVDTTEPILLRELQTLASWSARYALVCRFMRPHTSTLFDALKPYRGRSHIKLPLSMATVVCIHLWRACLVLIELQAAQFARCLLSFRPQQPRLRIEYDASLSGVGILVNIISPDGQEHPWKALSCPLPYALQDDSSYQNSVEFIAVVLGVAGIAKFGVCNADIAIRGDNRSSLSWSLHESFKSPRIRNASVVFTFVGIDFDLRISEADHVAGVTNTTTDGWSRFYTDPQDIGYSQTDMLFATGCPILASLLLLLDPTHNALDSESTAIPFIRAAGLTVSSLASRRDVPSL